MEEHDDSWFSAHDNKYWSATRFICFWGSILSMFGATLAAGILIFLMPRNCDPSIDWYHGTVTLDVSPSDLANLDLNEYHAMGIQTLHLRDLSRIVPSTNGSRTDLSNMYQPTKDIIDLIEKLSKEVSEETSKETSDNVIKDLARSLHALNMTLMVQVPVVGTPDDTDFHRVSKSVISLALEQQVENVVKYLMESGADGIFLDGLERFGADDWVADSVMSWKKIIDRFGVTDRSRILMTSYKFAHNLDLNANQKGWQAMKVIDLLDATFDLDPIYEDANFTVISEALASIAAWDAIEERPWINWNLKSDLKMTNAARALQMLLPGTININSAETQTKNMTSVRAVAVPIFMNGNYKPCHCDQGEQLVKETNYHLHQPVDYVIQLERFYSRRHRYVLVANLGHDSVSLDAVGRIYSGGQLVLDTENRLEIDTQVTFKSIALAAGQAIVIKLPK